MHGWMDGIAGLIVMERMYLQKESRADVELYFLFFPQTNTNKYKSQLWFFFLLISPFSLFVVGFCFRTQQCLEPRPS